MKNFKKIMPLFLLSVLLFQTANAQQIEVKATIDSTNLLIGQQTLIRLEVVQPKGTKVDFPYFKPEDTLTTHVEILAISKADTSKADKEKILIKQNYLITSFDSGSYVIPPFKFRLIDQDYETNSLILNVDNVQIKENEEIKEIKPLYQPPFDWLLFIGVILLIMLVLALIGVGIYFYILKKKNRPIPIFEKQEIVLPPHEIALQKLTAIKEEKIWQKGQDKLYYTQLTDVLREYLAERFDIQAMEMTSAEIMAALQTDEEAKVILDKLKQIFSVSDMVKFAKIQPTPEDNEMSIVNGFFVVNQTKIEMPAYKQSEDRSIYTMRFLGEGREYFGVVIVNWLLTLITLGLYYPWARARKIKYLYGATALINDRFVFHGKGKEMFRGFVKVIILYIVLVGILCVAQYQVTVAGNLGIYILLSLVFYAGFFAVIPLIIHGAYRYRMSRTTWRGIRFGYRGSKKQLYIDYLKWLGLSFITFGIYSSWFIINLRKYIIGNIRIGDIKFKYKGEGIDLFWINLKGYLLTLVTLGIYSFWWEKDSWNYYIDNVSLHKNDKNMRLKSSVTGKGIFKLRIVNLLLTVFSLGLAYAWVVVRTRKYFTENTHLEGNINLNKIKQTEEIYTDATFEDATDFFDIDIF